MASDIEIVAVDIKNAFPERYLSYPAIARWISELSRKNHTTYQGLHNMCPQKVYDFLDQDKVYPVE